MPTIINTRRGEDANSGVSLAIGIIAVLIAIVLFFAYVLPSVRNTGSPSQDNRESQLDVNLKVPSNNTGNTAGQPQQ